MQCPNCGREISAYSQRCASCGKIIPPAQHLLEECGVVEPSFLPPTPSAASRPVYRAARLGDRLLAAMLDSFVLLGTCAVVGAWSFTRLGVASGTGLQLTTASLLVVGTLGALIVFAYLWLLEAAFQATLGKMMVGIRVVRTNDRGALAASAIRNVLRIVDGIGFYLVGAIFAECSRRRQRLGDMIAGTVVVEESFSEKIKLLAVVLWVGSLAGTAWALPRVCAGGVSTTPPRYFGRSVVELSHKPDSVSVRVSRLSLGVQFAPTASPEGVARVDSAPR